MSTIITVPVTSGGQSAFCNSSCKQTITLDVTITSVSKLKPTQGLSRNSAVFRYKIQSLRHDSAICCRAVTAFTLATHQHSTGGPYFDNFLLERPIIKIAQNRMCVTLTSLDETYLNTDKKKAIDFRINTRTK